MDLIVTHNNADFDALSSAIAAHKLYQNSKILLPGSQEASVRQFLSLSKDTIQIESEKTCDFSNIDRLIIVDTRHRHRIGRASELLDGKREVHIYDHHPRMAGDIKGTVDIYQEAGATVTILLNILKNDKSIEITPFEATIMLLGIYEETGSLSFRTTTRADVDLVSFLLGQGANLQAVSSYLNRELTEEELGFLIELINKTEVHLINGINVAITTADAKVFIGELSTLVHKLQEVENHPVLFAFFKKNGKCRIIARSREEKVDVNEILKNFNGGGHASAATAKIEGKEPDYIKQKLLRILKTKIKINISAKDVMSKPVRTISINKTIYETKKLFKRLNIKEALCTEKGKTAGIITDSDLNKALRHHYGHSRVKGYMRTNVISIKEHTPLHIIQKIMFERNIGRLPVLKKKKLIGIVTRTGVLKRVHSDLFGKPDTALRKQKFFNLSNKMRMMLPKQINELLRLIGNLAEGADYAAYIVGGFVRDILLGVKNFDIDIVLEGDAIEFGSLLAKRLRGALVVHRKFGTSTVVMDWPKGVKKPSLAGPRFKIDFSTARRETYHKPAALPTVQFSSLKNDLLRRDFSINAMAVSLNKKNFGALVDFYNGLQDLKDKKIRVLHEASFIDDPTRIFRAVRFEQRFSFKIDNYTEGLIKNAVKEKMFKKTQNQRIRDELILILKEESPLKALRRMQELHELRFIHKRIVLTKEIENIFKNCLKAFNWYNRQTFKKRNLDLYIMYLACLIERLGLKETEELCSKFVFKRGDRIRLVSYKKRWKQVLKLLSTSEEVSASKIYRLLEPLSYEVILVLWAKSNNRNARMRISLFLEKYNGVKIRLKGEDLKRLGLKSGPQFKKLLTKILYAKLDGKVKTKKEELEYLKRIVCQTATDS